MKNFNKESHRVRSLVEKANEHKDARLETSHDRFHFFSEHNEKGLFSFGIYDYVTKEYELVDIFDTDVGERLDRIHTMLGEFT